jgi:carboxyl-terminal processing protease
MCAFFECDRRSFFDCARCFASSSAQNDRGGLVILSGARSAQSKGAALIIALLFSLGICASARAESPSISAYDFIELEIAYTTLLARYYKPIAPATLVNGARNGVAAELRARGIEDASLPLTPAHVDRPTGSDLIDALVLRPLARYGSRVDGHALVAAAVAGELGILRDPYTVVFRPAAFKKFNAYLGNATFGGIGAIVSLDTAAGRAPIERALDGSPAAQAGLQSGDAIVAIDGKPVSSMSNATALLGALRGKVGTRVTLSVLKANAAAPVQLTLVRAVTRDPEVHTANFDGIAYIALSRFGDTSGKQVAEAAATAAHDGARAIVLDLRGNGGGYGDEAVAVASVFLPPGPIFTEHERSGTPIVHRATGTPVWTGPLAVLIDGDTASAAEIVAGAVQDVGRGAIVGARSFGKGVVQSIFDLPDGSAMKVTTSRYTTPAGHDIDHVGITPDIPVVQPAGSRVGEPAADPQLRAALAKLATEF